MTTETLANQTTGTSGLSNEMLPVDPFRSLYVHFGMLLGVDDFQTLDAYHRGKMWYHSAWLHGKGVVWGLDVQLPQKSVGDDDSEETQFLGEVRVEPGLAIDGMGRELLLEHAACLNLAAWYQANQDEVDVQQAVTVDEETGDLLLDGHVTLEFRGCLTRQVPALSESCDTSATSTAYSRVVETVNVCMHPGLADIPSSEDYYRLRLLCGLVEPRVNEDGATLESDLDVLDAKAEIKAASEDERAALCKKWFDHFAILDGIDIRPETQVGSTNFAGFPHLPQGEVVLANLTGLRLHQEDDKWTLVEGEVDPFVRPFLLPTDMIQSLLCCDTCCNASSTPATDEEKALVAPDAGGPRIDSDSVEMQGTENIVFNAVGSPLMKASVSENGLRVSAFDTRDGWVPCKIKDVHYKAAENQVRIELRDAPAGTLIRLIVKGTGEAPFLGRNRIPLAGGMDSPAGSNHQGNDFVFMFRARSGS